MYSHPTRVGSTVTFVVAFLVMSTLVGLPGRVWLAQPDAAGPHVPNDPGGAGRRPAGWSTLQWNFDGPFGVDATRAWGNLLAVHARGGAGVTVAVLDTGVAYPSRTASRRPGSPDLDPKQFVRGYDFVAGDDDPYDENGHGTHVASTIAEKTDNSYGLTGLAYGVRIMPVRVLDRNGDGDDVSISRGLRFAATHGAKVINLSLSFAAAVTTAQIPHILKAIEFAHDRGVLVVAGAGNLASSTVSLPGRDPQVLAVGATTEHGCLANYSSHGSGMDIVAPGGGRDANISGDPSCRPGRSGRSIYQMTMVGRRLDHFGIAGFVGTSMAAPHVSAVAALVIASRVIGRDPSPTEIADRLEQTARDLGRPGRDDIYGWGLVDATSATTPGEPRRPRRRTRWSG
jgi:serine protease